MTTINEQIRNYLQTDTSLVALMTGGMYTFEDTGRLGITYTNLPAAFDGAMLKPCLLVKVRSINPTSELRDEENQVMSYRRGGQVFLYQEGGTSIIDQAVDLLYNMLHDKQPFVGVRSMFADLVEGRQDESLNGASLSIFGFTLAGIKEN